MAVQQSIPEDDWVTAEANALLDGVPGLRDSLQRQRAEAEAGTLKVVDTATVRAAIEASVQKARSGE